MADQQSLTLQVTLRSPLIGHETNIEGFISTPTKLNNQFW